MTQPFIFGGNTGHSYEDIKKMRARADAIKPSLQTRGGIAGFGDGLSALGRALMYRSQMKAANAADAENKQKFSTAFNDWSQNPQFDPQQTEQTKAFGGIDPRLLKIAHNPYATQGQRALMQLMLQRQLDASKPKDQMRELQLKKMQLDIDKMQKPQQSQRNIIKGADGYQYYQDSGERVLPNVQKPEEVKPEFDFKTEQGLRKEFTSLPTIKDFSGIKDSWGRVQASAKDPSAAGDLALVFNYMKILDPGSVVREGEFATAQNAAGVDERVAGMYNRLMSGERLTPNQRKDFVNRAGQMFNSQVQSYNNAVNQYRGYAEQYHLSPDRIANTQELYNPQAQEQTPKQTPSRRRVYDPTTGGFK